MNKLKVIYCASGEIAIPVLEALKGHPKIDLIKIITSPNKKAGRGKKETPPPAAKFCDRWKLPLLQMENVNHQDQVSNLIKKEGVDLVLVFAFSHFLKEKLLNAPRLGCFNIHPSLLPCYRGAAPLQYALLNGDKVTGVSIQKLVLKMDAGDIVLQEKLDIGPDEDAEKLQIRAAILAAQMMDEFITRALSREILYKKQDESKVSYAPLLKKEDGRLDFINQTAEQIDNRIRAFNPWPSTYFKMNDKRIKVIKAGVVDKDIPAGHVRNLNGLVIGCKKKSIRLMKIQREGKKPCSDIEFLNGLKEELRVG
ncbi:MAG: methionyl-tRNA formyltransferase [Halobacteriovoraceae bacterium]|nr:methionyl-tRNA formyltransferase [Halobacteriovoraceae bacterium]